MLFAYLYTIGLKEVTYNVMLNASDLVAYVCNVRWVALLSPRIAEKEFRTVAHPSE